MAGDTTVAADSAANEAVRLLRDAATEERQLLDQLWAGGVLLPSPARALDVLDELSSRVAATAILKATSCTLILPTAFPDRGPILFATALLAHWFKEKLTDGQTGDLGTVLYVGNSVGVRSALERTTVGGSAIRLSDFFAHGDIDARPSQGRRGRATQVRSGLPQVVAAFAPPDAAGLIRRHRPRWVAIDLTGERDAAWVGPLVSGCRALGVPVVAWTDNPLSSSVRPLLDGTLVVPIPPIELRDAGLYAALTTSITPLVMRGDTAEGIARLLGEAGRRLLSATRSAPDSRLVSDAVRAHWSLLRNLEYLPCPVDFWEANVGSHWGLHRLRDLSATCERFEQAVRVSYAAAAHDIARAGVCLGETLDLLGQSNPRWETAVELCLAGSPAGPGVEVNFGARGRRALFIDAFLALYGFSEDDLKSVGVHVRALGSEREDPAWVRHQRLIVAEPVTANDARAVQHLLQHAEAEVLTYQAGLGRLRFLVAELVGAWKPENFAAAVRSLVGRAPTRLDVGARISLLDSIGVTTSGTRGRVSEELQIDQALDRDEELTRLLENGLDHEEDGSPTDDAVQAPDRRAAVDTVVTIEFAGGWWAQYQPDQTVMAVERVGLSAKRLDKPAHELQVGDEVIAIHGQQRQSLYELLVARLHKNAAIALHLALLEKWQEEIDLGYAAWSLRGGTLEGLLRAIQGKGSQMMSIAGVRLWLTGGTLAPQDPADIRRLGEVFGRPFVVANYQRIANAASRLRGLHRGLAHRLDNWLEDQATHDGNGPDPVIDEESGVRFSDFKSSLLRLEVVTIRIETGIFLTYRLGLLQQGAADG